MTCTSWQRRNRGVRNERAARHVYLSCLLRAENRPPSLPWRLSSLLLRLYYFSLFLSMYMKPVRIRAHTINTLYFLNSSDLSSLFFLFFSFFFTLQTLIGLYMRELNSALWEYANRKYYVILWLYKNQKEHKSTFVKHFWDVRHFLCLNMFSK